MPDSDRTETSCRHIQCITEGEFWQAEAEINSFVRKTVIFSGYNRNRGRAPARKRGGLPVKEMRKRMEEKRLYSPNLVCVCVQGRERQDYYGEIWHQYSGEPVEFSGVAGMVEQMERFYDQWDYPQKSTYTRHFQNRTTPARRAAKPDPGQKDMETLWHKRGALGTFVVHVQYRQNSTWQGRVIWVERQRQMDFSSELDLLKIMDDALKEGLDK